MGEIVKWPLQRLRSASTCVAQVVQSMPQGTAVKSTGEMRQCAESCLVLLLLHAVRREGRPRLLFLGRLGPAGTCWASGAARAMSFSPDDGGFIV